MPKVCGQESCVCAILNTFYLVTLQQARMSPTR